MRTTTILGTLASMAVMAAFIGCGGDDEIASKIPGVKTGTLEQNWTIEGSRDPMKCQQYRADRMRIVVLDAKGEVHATEYAACNTFQKALELQTDTYSGNATFVDTSGYPVSKTIPLQQFTILEDRRIPLSVDFTAGDMSTTR